MVAEYRAPSLQLYNPPQQPGMGKHGRSSPGVIRRGRATSGACSFLQFSPRHAQGCRLICLGCKAFSTTEAEIQAEPNRAALRSIVRSPDANDPLRKRDAVMVTKCANPSCSASFQYLRGGKLFLVDLTRLSSQPGRNGRTAEYFWLCDRCCSELTVTVDASGQAAIAKARAAGRV